MITLRSKLSAFAVIWFLSIILPTLAVRRGDFKTCDQASFCKRNRARATRAGSTEHATTWKSPYQIRHPPLWLADQRTLQAILVNDLYPDISFSLNASFVRGSEGTMRIKVDEMGGIRQRFNEADRWTLLKQPDLHVQEELRIEIGTKQTLVDWGEEGPDGAHVYRFSLTHHPLLITLYKDSQPHIVLNERGLFNMEHFREKSSETNNSETPVQGHDGLKIQETSTGNVPAPLDQAYPGFKDDSEEGMWEENFGGRTDSKPKGNCSLYIYIYPFAHLPNVCKHACLNIDDLSFSKAPNLSVLTLPFQAISTSMVFRNMLAHFHWSLPERQTRPTKRRMQILTGSGTWMFLSTRLTLRWHSMERSHSWKPIELDQRWVSSGSMQPRPGSTSKRSPLLLKSVKVGNNNPNRSPNPWRKMRMTKVPMKLAPPHTGWAKPAFLISSFFSVPVQNRSFLLSVLWWERPLCRLTFQLLIINVDGIMLVKRICWRWSRALIITIFLWMSFGLTLNTQQSTNTLCGTRKRFLNRWKWLKS